MWRSLSIYGRTFLLMLAALVVAEAVGIAFVIYRPPTHDAPVQFSALARVLAPHRVTGDAGFPEHGFPGPPPSGGEPPPGGPPGPPGPPGAPGAPPDTTLTVTSSGNQPVLANSKLASAETLRTLLASQLGAQPAEVVFYATAADERSAATAPIGSIMLRDSFVAGARRSDGSWRYVNRVVEGFPNALQRRAMLLFALGAATLLPLAWLFARALSAPIRRFSEAAQRLGMDPNAPALPREGPKEMLVAVDSFNSMQARLNRLIRERTNMVGAIAHDLRTPLTRLAFRLDDLPSPLREKVDRDIQEMKTMISAALDFIRDRSLAPQLERLDLRLLVEGVVDNQGDLGHDVTLEGGVPLTITGNPLALRRMVGNLVENALKYGERARLRLRVVNERCVLEVDDDGPGIPESLQEQVFEPFFRLESSRNRDTGGIGLGLSTVRAIVLEHGGEITLGNRRGGGLRVSVVLPVTL
jgi:two-component system, OmpR family, sensor kinase